MSKRTRILILVAVAVAVAALLWRFVGDGSVSDSGVVFVADAESAAAMVALEDGGLLFGERLSGRIRQVDPEGRPLEQPVAVVTVSTEGQRGLLGLAVDDEEVFAAWTRPDLRLVVARVAPGMPRRVWLGPVSADLGNGGHLEFAPDGRLVVGIGDLRAPHLVSEPDAPNGKLLALDPTGPPRQRPEVLSSGWNNPFAFTFTPGGDLWVADNSPGRRPERLARGDLEAPTITDLPEKVAPSGLAAPADGRLLLCGYVARTLQIYAIDSDGRATAEGRPLATDCAVGVTVLENGSVVYATENSIRLIDDRPGAA